LAPEVAFALKWPNDVLADGAKVAGVLLESEAQEPGLAIVIGIGLNLASAPEGMPFPAQSLLALGHAVTAEDAFARLTDAWVPWVRLWNEGRGFDAVREAWLARATGIGQAVSVRTGDRVDTGTFETLDEQGRLILRQSDGTSRTISAGDVYFGDAAGIGASS
jgi:BirA family biotin operon repressor/biotin-[acetyl-CoA-carboxylase] ligase